jgi:Spy/CpxP family protein refolding chaperone
MAEAPTAPRRSAGLLAVTGVFLLGLVCGAALFFAGTEVLHARAFFGRRGGDREGRVAIARMVREIGLDAQQQEQVRAVIERTREKVREGLEQSRAEIRSLLRPDQQEKFDRWRPARPRFPRGGPGRPPDR